MRDCWVRDLGNPILSGPVRRSVSRKYSRQKQLTEFVFGGCHAHGFAWAC